MKRSFRNIPASANIAGAAKHQGMIARMALEDTTSVMLSVGATAAAILSEAQLDLELRASLEKLIEEAIKDINNAEIPSDVKSTVLANLVSLKEGLGVNSNLGNVKKEIADARATATAAATGSSLNAAIAMSEARRQEILSRPVTAENAAEFTHALFQNEEVRKAAYPYNEEDMTKFFQSPEGQEFLRKNWNNLTPEQKSDPAAQVFLAQLGREEIVGMGPERRAELGITSSIVSDIQRYEIGRIGSGEAIELFEKVTSGDISKEAFSEKINAIRIKEIANATAIAPKALDAMLESRPTYKDILKGTGIIRADGTVDYEALMLQKKQILETHSELKDKAVTDANGKLSDAELALKNPGYLEARAIYTLSSTINGFRISEQIDDMYMSIEKGLRAVPVGEDPPAILQKQIELYTVLTNFDGKSSYEQQLAVMSEYLKANDGYLAVRPAILERITKSTVDEYRATSTNNQSTVVTPQAADELVVSDAMKLEGSKGTFDNHRSNPLEDAIGLAIKDLRTDVVFDALKETMKDAPLLHSYVLDKDGKRIFGNQAFISMHEIENALNAAGFVKPEQIGNGDAVVTLDEIRAALTPAAQGADKPAPSR